MKRAVWFALISPALLGVLVLGWSFHLVERRRAFSPDGHFYAVASCRAWRTFVPAMPGGGSDQPGYVTVFTHEGQSCGTVPLPLAWMLDDMEWSSTRAELSLVAEWDLVACTVHR